jgi:ligand-binding SRPBCC domain-containing protein
MTRLILVTDVRAPAARCFDLSRDIDLHARSMNASGERAIAGVTSGLIGPFASWRHEHRFEPQNGYTRMVDDVVYRVPLSIIGRAVDAVRLRRHLRRPLETRNHHIKLAAESTPASN